MREKMNAVCLPERYMYEILPGLSVEVEVETNPFSIPIDTMFAMAARKNKKRRFLFVSKILGKHTPVDPLTPIIAGQLLAARFMQEVYGTDRAEGADLVQALLHPERRDFAADSLRRSSFSLTEDILVIGFAETATALGAAFFASFGGRARYIHTTREKMRDAAPQISFEEEHSHATSHRCYALEPDFLRGSGPVVLVDDEITTGKTALNIIAELHAQYPRSEYVVASLLDWRSAKDRESFAAMERLLCVRIRCVSIISGKIKFQQETGGNDSVDAIPHPMAASSTRIEEYSLAFSERVSLVSSDSAGVENSVPYVQATGRFGITSQQLQITGRDIEDAAAFLKSTRRGGRTLCMGTGEFMYVPMQIAARMGEDVFYQSTTRSPIYPADRDGYAVHSAFSYPSPEDLAVTHYFYNITPGMYSELYLFMERKVEQERMDALYRVLRSLGIAHISVVTLSEGLNLS